MLTYCTCSRSTDADIAERVHFWIIENIVSGIMFSERRSRQVDRSCRLEKTLGGRSKILRYCSRRRSSMRNQAPLFSSIFERDLVDQIITILLLIQPPIIRLALRLLLSTVGQQELPLLPVRKIMVSAYTLWGLGCNLLT